MEKLYYSYEEYVKDCIKLASEIKDFDADAILAVARGGVTLGHGLSNALDNRNLLTINSISYDDDKMLNDINIFNIPDLSKYNKVLIVDDIVDTGNTLFKIDEILKEKFPNVEFRIASLFYKKTAVIKPDYYVKEANQWIDFFWEVDIKL